MRVLQVHLGEEKRSEGRVRLEDVVEEVWQQPPELHSLLQGLAEDLRIQPAPHVIVDKAGATVLLWDETHQAHPESWDTLHGVLW